MTWQLFTASVRGSTHVAATLPNQDAVAFRGDPGARSGPLVVAVADGHGDPRHSRSERGSRLAVEVACDLAQRLGARLHGSEELAAVDERARTELLPALVEGWRTAVTADLARDPLPAGQAAGPSGDPVVAYGSTLLVALITARWAVLAQIGDGDVLTVDASGAALLPLPPDPWSRGRYTSSLCQDDALSAFRFSVVDLARTPLAALLLATDGFGNSQVQDPWYPAFSADLLRLVGERGVAWVGEHLEGWAELCASSEGSGDDTTLALMLGEVTAR